MTQPAAEPSTGPSGDEPVVAGGEDARTERPLGALDDLVAVLGVYVGLGVLAAVLWWVLFDPAIYTVRVDGGLEMGEVELGKRFNGDAWYAVIAAVLGLVSGTVLTWWRGRDPLLTVGLVLLGSLVAAGVMAVVGGWIGPPDPHSVIGSLEVGDTLSAPLDVDAAVCYLVWPVTALIGALVVLWSPPPAETG